MIKTLLTGVSLALISGCASQQYDDRYRYINDLALWEWRENMKPYQINEWKRYWAAQQVHYLDLLMQRHPTCEPFSHTVEKVAQLGLTYSKYSVAGLVYVAPKMLVDGRQCRYGSTRRIDCERYIRANEFLFLDSQACRNFN